MIHLINHAALADSQLPKLLLGLSFRSALLGDGLLLFDNLDDMSVVTSNLVAILLRLR